MQSVEDIITAYENGQRLKFLFFWGHSPKADGTVSKACLSQWWEAHFEVAGHTYLTAEHWMMARKAHLFGDEEITAKILEANSPGAAKSLGRQVKDFEQSKWEAHRMAIEEEGNYHKFNQNPDLKAFLLNTQNRILVEASPVDAIWGIGMAADHDSIKNPLKWRGKNLLGFALMNIRERLKANS